MKRVLIPFYCTLLCIIASVSTSNAQLYINEFLASNETNITDESGDNEDWIEIYNAGSSAIDLAGYYISDDITDPLIWQIPSSNPGLTTVPAGGYLILWADKDTDDGENHVDIKLGAGGEDIILTNPDGVTVVDQLTFGAQTDDISYGRETDGDPNFVFFNTPSPNAENVAGGTPTFTITIDVAIATANDDAEEFPGGGVTLSSSDIELVDDFGNLYTSAFRFNDIGLPSDAVINSAYIQLTADEVNTGACNLTIHAENAGNSAPLQTTSNNISSRNTTATSTSWAPAAWSIVGESGANQATPDLTSVVEEVISNAGWAEGNAMTFIFTGTGTRIAEAFDSAPGQAARLIIEAEVPLDTDPIPQVYINEIAANVTTFQDPGGTQEDWVEIYNPNNEDIDLGGLYLSDKLSSLDKWQISPGTIVPANGYLIFWTDNDDEEGPLHTNFSLKAGGEDVVLSQLLATGLTVIDAVTYEDMPFMGTYGRETDGAANLVFFGEITPDASNNGSDLYLNSPEFSIPSGSYSSSQSVSISTSESGTTIYYTTDGTLPSTSSSIYNGSPVTISSTGSLRAIATKAGFTNSQPSDATYLINENHNIPLLYITTDPDNFFDDEIGLYVDGTNGVVAYCATEPVNWAQDWERPINLKMFETNGDLAFDVDAGVEINGACSRNFAMKSLGINLRDKVFGDEAIEYPLFPERDHEDYQRLKLRNSGQDFIRLGFRDMVNQNMITGKLDIDLQAGRPSRLYINGEFWGLYNIREKFAGEYFEAIYDVNENDLDIIKSPGLPWRDVKKGSDVIYNALYDVVENSNMSNDSDWEYFESQVDVNEMMNYWITMTYMNNYDWPANNLTVWRERAEGAKWRYGMADTDGSTQNMLTPDAEPSYNKFERINDPNITNWPDHSNSTLFLRKALDRQEFRDEFIQRSCSIIELLYNEDRTNSFIDEMVALFQPNVQDQIDRWGFDNAMGGSENSWNQWVQLYRDFYDERPDFWRQHVNDQYNLSGYYDLTVSFDANSGGDVVVNTNEMELPYNYTGTYFRNVPLRLKAIPQEGYVFLFWLETGDTNAEIDYVGTGNFTLTPIFELDDCNNIPPGTACNDGDDCTENDVYDANCDCAGTFADDDGDGVCNAEDQCPGFDDNIDVNNNGVPDGCDVNCTDDDGDGICVEDDCNDNDSSIPAAPGTPCDDGNAQTTNDVIQGDECTCQGEITPPTGEYCDASADFPWHEWISNVQLNEINNPSGKSAYSDFTSIFANLAAGSSNTINLTATYSYTAHDEYFRVWIDYNQNNVFDEPGEIAFSGILSGIPDGTNTIGVLNGTINVPGSAASGTTRMRISMSRGAYAEACGVHPQGEVEDYSVVIGEGSGAVLTVNNCPSNITQTAATGQNSMTVNWTAPTGSSTCDPNNVTVTQTAGPPSGSSFNIGTTTTISYSISDQCGNQETCSFTITINAPNNGSITLNCPSDIFVQLQSGQNSTVINWNAATGSTSCPSGGLIITQIGGQPSGSSFSAGTYQIAYSGVDNCTNAESCTFNITVAPDNSGGEYCDSEGEFPWHDYIGNVELNTIVNPSGKTSYSDFTNISTSLIPSLSYDISLTANFSYTTYNEHFKVWIDYNQNGIFEEPAEVALYEVLSSPGDGTPSATLNGTINVPGNASAGSTRMRIAMKRGGEPGPCEVFPFGEVEDYTINIPGAFNGNNPQGFVQQTPNDFRLFPNPASNEVTLILENAIDVKEINVFNVTAQSILYIEGAPHEQVYQFDVRQWHEGIYFLQIQLENGQRITKRFIVADKK